MLKCIFRVAHSDPDTERSYFAYDDRATFKNARAVCVSTGGDVVTAADDFNVTVAQEYFDELGSR